MTERLNLADCRAAGYCVRGTKRRCADLGVDFRKLMGEGVPFEELEPLGDGDVNRCISFARDRIGRANVVR